MQPTEIVRELKKRDSVVFGKLELQMLGAWIKRDEKGAWWLECTLERVTQANKPGGVKTQVGVLVSIKFVSAHYIKAYSFDTGTLS
jgi:hypothetical protein